MHKYLFIDSMKVPTYGMIVLFGVIVVNLIAGYVVKKTKLEIRQFMLMESIGGFGAIIGAKLLAFLESALMCSTDVELLILFQKAGYSYYGGLFLFLLSIYVYSVCFGSDVKAYAEKLFFLLPFLHGIWKIGCYCGGCCIGIPYEGRFSIVYPVGVNTLSGIRCIPLQLIEAAVDFLICLRLIILGRSGVNNTPIAEYLQLYGMTRFALEFFRYHENGGVWSLSHIMSCICFVMGRCLSKKATKEAMEEV